jgi:hypothetical protein
MSLRLLLVPALLFCGCSHQQLSPVKVNGKSLHGGLALVPSNTPYLFTSVDPVPKAMMKKLLEIGAKAARQQMKQLVNDEKYSAVAKALLELYSVDGFAKYGLSVASTKGLFYSLGSTPVMRLSLADEKRFDAFLLDVLAKAEITWEAERVGKHLVRSVALPNNEAMVVVQLYHLGDLVLALAPSKQVGELVPWLVGEKRPAESIVHSPRLAEMLKNPSGNGTSLYAAGTLNFLRLAEALGFDEHVHPDILSSMLRSNKNYMTDARHQMRLLTSFLGDSQITMTIDESGLATSQLRQALAASLSPYLKGLAVAVPGPQDATKTLLNFGFGVDLARLRELLNQGASAHVATVKAAGYKTTKPTWVRTNHLGALKAADSQAGEDGPPKPSKVERPMVQPINLPAALDKHHGARIALLGINLDQASPLAMIGSLRLAVIIATEDFDGLLAMAKGKAQLAKALDSLEIPANGKAVSLNGRAPLPGLSIMRNERALALTFGSGVAESAESWLAAKPATAPPLMESNADGKFLAQAMGFAFKQMSAKLNTPKGREALAGMEASLERLSNSGSPSLVWRVDQDALLFNLSYSLVNPQSP